ncbi:sulfite exporter TauE/SafE family protein [Mycobacterium sp. DL592]|uniref:sulfite exporter TauE/SafE family protein n=1 Tax=Mycobacterium sp. DL592 TaxID=2675524 RepID=UPI00141DC7E1|nr:sulfite exporter TauE/SafE family protein [Mycobacterium sp. DL592]
MHPLTGPQLAVLAVAGLVGGAANAAAGGGSMATFPVLIALGVPPISANVTNTLGHAPGYVAIVVGLRQELAGQRHRLRWLIPLAGCGAAAGAVLLSVTPSSVFRAAAPYLVLLACALIALQPLLRRSITVRPGGSAPAPALIGGLLLGCGYAGYFGAGAGFITLASLSLVLAGSLQVLNALSRLCICVANFVALPILLTLNSFDLTAAVTLWPTTMVGGYLGARAVRSLPEWLLRTLIITLGLAGAAYLFIGR